jgi:hypothetical protein
MTPARTFACYALAIAIAALSVLGAQVWSGVASGDLSHAFRREPVDLAAYWLGALPACYLAAGALGYLGPVRTWRWIFTMIAVQAAYTLVVAGSGLSLLPFALGMMVVLSLPGLLSGWLGGMIRRRHDARVAC